MEDEIRISKTENGGTVMVNVSAINRLIDELSCESAIERLKRSTEMYDDFYDDDLCYSSPRQKRAKDNNEFQVYDWGEIVRSCLNLFENQCYADI